MNMSAWLQAAEYGDAKTLEALLAERVDVNAKTASGMTALMHAASKNHADALFSLLDKGADVNARRQDGMTALMLAAFFGHADIVRALINNGADARAQDNHGSTALRWASSRGYPKLVQLLKQAERSSVAVSVTAHQSVAHTIVAPPEVPEQKLDLQSLKNEHLAPDESDITIMANAVPAATFDDDEETLITKRPIPFSASSDDVAIEEISVTNGEKTIATEESLFNYKRYRTKRSFSKKFRLMAIIVPAVLLFSGVSIYTATQNRQQNIEEALPRPQTTDYYYAQPTMPLLTPSQESKQASEPMTTSPTPVAVVPNMTAPVVAKATAVSNAKNSVAPLQPLKSLTARRNDDPVIISFTPKDNGRRELRTEPSKSDFTATRGDDDQPRAATPRAVRAHDTAATSSAVYPPRELSNSSDAPKKKVIRWP